MLHPAVEAPHSHLDSPAAAPVESPDFLNDQWGGLLGQLAMIDTVDPLPPAVPRVAVTPEATAPTSNLAERDWRTIHDLLDANELSRGRYEAVTVGEAGYAIKFTDRPVVPGNDVVLYDLDDTLIGYSEARAVRLAAYERYAQETGLGIDSEAGRNIMSLTDSFSRWIGVDGRDTYNVTAHMASLAWISAEIRTLPPEARTAEAINELGEQLSATKNPVKTAQAKDQLPFFFDEGQFVITKPDLVLPDITTVFEPMLQPERYQDSIAAVLRLGETVGSEQQVNQIGLTYGTPGFQLAKFLALMNSQAASGQPLPVSQLWLTRVPKGEFIAALAGSLESPADAAHDIAQELFNDSPNSVVLIDDGPYDLESVGALNEQPLLLPWTIAASLRYRRAGTKRADQPWAPRLQLPGITGVYNAPEGEDGRSLGDDIYLMLTALIRQRASADGLDVAARQKLTARQAAYQEQQKRGWAEGGSLHFLPNLLPTPASPASARPPLRREELFSSGLYRYFTRYNRR